MADSGNPARANFGLPSNHFLALPPSFGQASLSHPASDSLAPPTTTLASADFDVDVRTGFLPGHPGIDRLPDEYALWEELLEQAKAGVVKINGAHEEGGSGDRWRQTVKNMEVQILPQAHLTSQILQRASVTLAFLLHFYVHSHSGSTSDLAIPPSIAVPLDQVSNLLGLPPILTYATTVLYNVYPSDPTKAFHPTANPPNRVYHTFTGLPSEAHFYLVSSLVELHGVRALTIMRSALDEAFVGDTLALRRIASSLRALATVIDSLTSVMKQMRAGCDPAEFYWLIRPWFKGSDGDGPGGLGWLFQGVGEDEDSEGERKIVSGPSAGQSSLVHALDIFLGVDHTPHKPTSSTTTSSSTVTSPPPPSGGDSTFMQRMLQYMPGPHRTFLLHLQTSHPTVRELVVQNQSFDNGDLARSYDLAVVAMGKFRDYHMVIVTMYIIQQARRPPPAHFFPQSLPATSEPEKVIDTEKETEEPIRGTGGTALAQFLKTCKSRTVDALVGDS
ncbi:INDO [Phaffia rhodozyma]|uniref:INDO n=1 Tax=Phaffia rhodozyma TaxID=264483 RepID=A0A0F7SL16_PHARH|nr:INDO [Phaffia rhodozyma]